MMGVASTGTGAKGFFSFFIAHTSPYIGQSMLHIYFLGIDAPIDFSFS
jgi:hypothetical protein